MCIQFNPDTNPIADIVLGSMMIDEKDFITEENIINLYHEIYEYLTIVLENEHDAELLDFDMLIDLSGDSVEIMPKNLITGLWFSGIFPLNCEKVEEVGKFAYEGKLYTLNKKEKKLRIENP